MNRLTKVLTNALDKACPLSPARTLNKNNPFTPQLKQLRKEVGVAYSKHKDNPTVQNKEVYTNRLKRYKMLLSKTKKDHHARYVDSIKNEEEMSHFVKGLLKQKNGCQTLVAETTRRFIHKKSRGGTSRTGFNSFSFTQTNNTVHI